VSFLDEIVATKRREVEGAKQAVSLDQLRARALELRDNASSHRLSTALSRDSVNIIAEFKRKSPSKGVIRADVDPQTVVSSYEKGGAVGISVLTEESYFSGSKGDLRNVKSAVNLPVLRKDFLFDEFQIYESAVIGADAVLLIVAALNDESLRRLRRVTEDDLGLDALVEVHDAAEMERAVAAGAKLIGVNNRNLHTFEVSLSTSFELAGAAPKESILISESGLNNGRDLSRLRDAGYGGFLIGESLMRAADPELALKDLIASVSTGFGSKV
jgi:indole-3-glycerol phosphate synthase